jgi:hypothetical protein
MGPLSGAGSGIPDEAATLEGNVAATPAVDDCRTLIGSRRTRDTAFLIVNRQSAIGNENPRFRCGRAKAYWPKVML